jgi:TonB-linked SusC/RagA family outer membrane protein
MRKLLMLLALVVFAGSQLLLAQTKTISGNITAKDDGMPLPGVSIAVKGTTTGTVTDGSGKYQLTVPANAETLVVSFIGMKTQEIAILGRSTINVQLESENIGIEEVIAVAYGTAKKESFTGSADVVKADKLAKRTVGNITKALEGQVAGIQTTSGGGQPGSGSRILIRGFGSINSSNDPLYVVDGIPYDGNINAINPSDIESMVVLKDASAGALYGARGSNGVVLITTKRGAGQGDKISVNLKASWGISSRAIPEYETMNQKEYIEASYLAHKHKLIYTDGVNPELAKTQAIAAMNGINGIFGVGEQYNPYNIPVSQLIDPVTGKVNPSAKLIYTDNWIDEVTASNPLRSEYQLSISGGTDKTKVFSSIGYLNEEGLLATTKFERFSGRLNIDSKPKKWLNYGMSTNMSHTVTNFLGYDGSSTANVWYSAQLIAPIYPVYQRDANGALVLDGLGKKQWDYGKNRPAGASPNFNSVGTLYEDHFKTLSDNVSARTYMKLLSDDNTVLKGLSLTANFGFDYVTGNQSSYYNPFFGNAAGDVKGRLTKTNGRTFSYTFNQLLNYSRSFGDHNIDALVGHEYYSYVYNNLNAQKTGFPLGGLYELDAAATIASAGSYENNYRIESVLSRLNYNFKERYYFSGSFRTDGSSRFHKDHRWGEFWSVGATWRISEESFMKDNISWLDNLSIKGSFGVQGNDAISSLYAWQSFYDLGYPNASMNGAVITSLENKSLKWEKNENFNAGIEAKMFGRLNLGLEVYHKKTKDLLLQFPMPTSLGFDSYWANVGSMKNIGFDLSVGGNIVKTDNFEWNANVIASKVKNEVIKLANKPEIIGSNTIIKEGETLNSFYVVKSAGVDPSNGEQLFWAYDVDANGNRGDAYVTNDVSKIAQSRVLSGSRIPDLSGSISTDFKIYKNFDLSILTTYSMGGKVLDGLYSTFMNPIYVGQNYHVHNKRAWTKPGDITDIPKLMVGSDYRVTDRNLIDASYFSIKNITVGYTFSKALLNRVGLESVRIFGTADNLVLFTHLDGMDPQYNFTGSTDFTYAPIRTFSIGLDVKF